jgi:hypothetical protein
VGLDVRQRKFLWPDAKRLDLDQSVRRINQQYPDFPDDKIEEFLIYWIQELYVPEGYSESQMDELERLTEQWTKDHERQRFANRRKEPKPMAGSATVLVRSDTFASLNTELRAKLEVVTTDTTVGGRWGDALGGGNSCRAKTLKWVDGR